jgi:hypothetical protein
LTQNQTSLQNTPLAEFKPFKHLDTQDAQLFVKTLNWENATRFNQSTYNFFFTLHGLSKITESSFSLLNTFHFFSDFNKRLVLDINPENILYSNDDNFTEEDFFFKNYINLRKSTFISFFVSNLVDIPICFKKSKSLKSKNFEFFFLKFTNLIMRKGKKEKTLRVI